MFRLIKMLRGKDLALTFLSLFLTILQVGCDIAQPFLLTELMSVESTDHSALLWQIWKVGLIMISLAVISFLLGSISTFTTARVSVRLGSKIRYELFRKVQSLTFVEIDEFSAASLITRITNDVMFFQNTLILILRVLLRSILIFIGGIIASFIYSAQLTSMDGSNLWWLAFIVLGFLFTLMLLMGLLISFAVPYFKKQQKQLDKTNGRMRENLLGIKVVKAFNLQNQQIANFDAQNSLLKSTAIKGQRIGFSVLPLIQFFVQVSIVVLLIVSSYLLGEGSNGIVPSFIQMVSLMVLGIILSVMVFVNLASAKASCDRINEVFNAEPSIPRNESENKITTSKVEFKNVNFRYNTGNKELNILEDISFTANPGEMIGIIGPTGSGKTTLINLITRNYDVNSGEIKISDFNIKDINYNSLRDSIGVSPQKSLLFSGTIKSNLMFGKEDATDEELIDACSKAEAYEFIKQKEGGLEASVEQRGSNFSGGQKQRLSIARALVRKPKILILDDSTSALDMLTESKVQKNIRSLKSSTIFLVGQRISAISKADKIIVLDKGKMVGYGSHEELLKNCSLYKEISESQAVTVEG